MDQDQESGTKEAGRLNTVVSLVLAHESELYKSRIDLTNTVRQESTLW